MINTDSDQVICIWPNDDWCYGNELEEWLQDHSDDFIFVETADIEDIEEFVIQYNRR